MIDFSSVNSWLKSGVEALNNIGSSLSGGLSASVYPIGATPLVGNSGNVANATATATLTGASGQTTYIEGFDVTSSGATAAAVVTVVVTDTGAAPILFGYTYASLAGATVGNSPLSIRFPRAIRANSQGSSITVTLPALGSGNAHAIVAAYGYRI